MRRVIFRLSGVHIADHGSNIKHTTCHLVSRASHLPLRSELECFRFNCTMSGARSSATLYDLDLSHLVVLYSFSHSPLCWSLVFNHNFISLCSYFKIPKHLFINITPSKCVPPPSSPQPSSPPRPLPMATSQALPPVSLAQPWLLYADNPPSRLFSLMEPVL